MRLYETILEREYRFKHIDWIVYALAKSYEAYVTNPQTCRAMRKKVRAVIGEHEEKIYRAVTLRGSKLSKPDMAEALRELYRVAYLFNDPPPHPMARRR